MSDRSPSYHPSCRGIRLTWPTVLALAACTAEPGDDNDPTTTTTTSSASSSTSDSESSSSDLSSDSSDSTTCPPPFAGTSESVFAQTSNRFVFESGEGYAMFNGAYYPAPQAVFHQESARQGLCRLLTYTHVACEPECLFEQTCAGGVCITPVAAQSLGSLELGGVLPAPIALQPDGIFHYSWQSEPFTATAQPTVTLSGQEPFALAASACPVPALVAADDWSAALAAREPGQDVLLKWQDPLPHARIYLRMTTGIGTHGGISPVEIECEGPDRGELTLPGAYLDQLYDGPFWSCGECGDNRLQRYHAGETAVGTGDDVVQVRAQSSHSFFYHPRLGG